MSQYSILEIFDMETGERRPVREFDRIIEAPNWRSDGDTILYNSEGRIWRYSLSQDLEPWEHLPDKQVELWAMDANGGNARKLLDLFGGQGTINVNSWAPDGKRFAFVSYR